MNHFRERKKLGPDGRQNPKKDNGENKGVDQTASVRALFKALEVENNKSTHGPAGSRKKTTKNRDVQTDSQPSGSVRTQKATLKSRR